MLHLFDCFEQSLTNSR